MVWTELCSASSHVTAGLTWELLPYQPDDPAALPYEGILLRGRSATPPPLVVFPHGGPHTVSSVDFRALTIGLAALGYAVLMGE